MGFGNRLVGVANIPLYDYCKRMIGRILEIQSNLNNPEPAGPSISPKFQSLTRGGEDTNGEHKTEIRRMFT